MVKSKKMSKTSIAVIVLALLLVLSMVMGITGAWFTDNAHDADGGKVVGNLKFGKIGAVDVAVTDATWVDANNKEVITSGEPTASQVLRTYVMPGDAISGTGIDITLTNGEGVNEKALYYLLHRSGDKKYYKVVEGSLVEVTDAAGQEAGSLTTAGLHIQAASAYVAIESSNVDIIKANATAIGNGAQLKDVQFKNGFIIGEQTYTLYVCQQTNLTAEQANALLRSADHATYALA